MTTIDNIDNINWLVGTLTWIVDVIFDAKKLEVRLNTFSQTLCAAKHTVVMILFAGK